MPNPSNKHSKLPPEARRENLIVASESMFAGAGFMVGAFVFVVVFAIIKIPGLTGYGWIGCLTAIAGAVVFAVFVGAGIVLGWWLWISSFAKRLAVTNEEIFFLAVGPFTIPIISRACLRVAGISKAEERKLRDARRKLN